MPCYTMVRDVGICLPSDPSDPKSLQEDTEGGTLEMVLVAPWWPAKSWTPELRAQPQTTMDPAGPGETPGPAIVLHIPRKSRDPEATHLQIITQGIEDVRFSMKVVDIVARGKLCATSVNVYDERGGFLQTGAQSIRSTLANPPYNR